MAETAADETTDAAMVRGDFNYQAPTDTKPQFAQTKMDASSSDSTPDRHDDPTRDWSFMPVADGRALQQGSGLPEDQYLAAHAFVLAASKSQVTDFYDQVRPLASASCGLCP